MEKSRGWAGEGEPPGGQGEAGAEVGEKVRDCGDLVMHEAGMRGERKEGVLGGSLALVLGGCFQKRRNKSGLSGHQLCSFECRSILTPSPRPGFISIPHHLLPSTPSLTSAPGMPIQAVDSPAHPSHLNLTPTPTLEGLFSSPPCPFSHLFGWGFCSCFSNQFGSFWNQVAEEREEGCVCFPRSPRGRGLGLPHQTGAP